MAVTKPAAARIERPQMKRSWPMLVSMLLLGCGGGSIHHATLGERLQISGEFSFYLADNWRQALEPTPASVSAIERNASLVLPTCIGQVIPATVWAAPTTITLPAFNQLPGSYQRVRGVSVHVAATLQVADACPADVAVIALELPGLLALNQQLGITPIFQGRSQWISPVEIATVLVHASAAERRWSELLVGAIAVSAIAVCGLLFWLYMRSG